jgi:hypothetical protein
MGSKSILLFVFLLALPLVSASTTPIEVTTMPYHTVIINILKPVSGYEQITFFKEIADFKGKVSVNYEDTSSRTKINLKILVKEGNEIVLSEDYTDYDLGSPIEIELFEEGYVYPFDDEDEEENDNAETNETNSTDTSTDTDPSETTDQNDSNRSNITGNVSSSQGSEKSYITYIIGGVILLAVIAFIIVMVLNKNRSGPARMPKNMDFDKKHRGHHSKEKKERFFPGGKSSSRLEELEKRLESLDDEIEELKEDDRIKQIEKKIADKEKLLKRLRNEKN